MRMVIQVSVHVSTYSFGGESHAELGGRIFALGVLGKEILRGNNRVHPLQYVASGISILVFTHCGIKRFSTHSYRLRPETVKGSYFRYATS